MSSLMKNWIHEQILHSEFSKNLNFRGLCCKLKENLNFEVRDFSKLYV